MYRKTANIFKEVAHLHTSQPPERMMIESDNAAADNTLNYLEKQAID